MLKLDVDKIRKIVGKTGPARRLTNELQEICEEFERSLHRQARRGGHRDVFESGERVGKAAAELASALDEMPAGAWEYLYLFAPHYLNGPMASWYFRREDYLACALGKTPERQSELIQEIASIGLAIRPSKEAKRPSPGKRRHLLRDVMLVPLIADAFQRHTKAKAKASANKVPSRFIRLTRIVFEAVGLDPVSEKTVHRALKHYGRE